MLHHVQTVMMPPVTFQMFGKASIRVSNLLLELRGPLTEAVLGIIVDAITSRKRHTREEVSTLLWPDIPYDDKRGSISVELSRIKTLVAKAMEDAGFHGFNIWHPDTENQDGVIKFMESLVYDYDVGKFKRIVETMAHETALYKLEDAVQLYRSGAFLEGLENRMRIKVSNRFQHWLAYERETLKESYHQLLHFLSIQYICCKDWEKALNCLGILKDHLVERDWAEEEEADGEELETDWSEGEEAEEDRAVVYSLLILCYGLTGQVALVKSTYNQYKSKMAERKSSDPAVQRLLETLLGAVDEGQFFSDRLINRLMAISRAPKLPKQLRDIYKIICGELGMKPVIAESIGFKRVIQRAKMLAEQHGWEIVGTPHLFWALREDSDMSVTDVRQGLSVLSDDALSLEQVAETVRETLGQPMEKNLEKPIETLALYSVRQEARNLAERMGADSIDVSHLWSALLQRQNSLLGRTLEAYGIRAGDLLFKALG